MARKSNMFGAAADRRAKEQQEIAAVVTNTPVEGSGKKTTITLSISEADKMAVKIYAMMHKTTVSDLLHEWIAQHCQE